MQAQRWRASLPWAASILGLVWSVFACGSNMDEGSEAYSLPPGTSGAGGWAPPKADAAADAAAEPLPPEQELESSYQSPVATGRFVWIANPTSGQVAFVDATTLKVSTVAAGNGPTTMAAVPHATDDVAIVINVRSHDATVLRRRPDGNLQTSTVAVHSGANSWTVSKQGRWAVAWSDFRKVDSPNQLEGFQEVTVVDLTEGTEKSTRLSVGYRPVAVAFTADETRAFAVTQDGISVMDLTAQAPSALKLTPISSNPLDDTLAQDVEITPDGAYALVRDSASGAVRVVVINEDKLVEVHLPGACTDMDLVADGSKALAAIRDKDAIAILPIPQIATDPSGFELVHVATATVGSIVVASDAPVALLYTNAMVQERITSLSFVESPATVNTLKLHAPVLAAFLSSDASRAIVLHTSLYSESSFSVLSLQPQLPAKIMTALAPITAVGLTRTGDRAILGERSDVSKVYGAYLVHGATQQVDRYTLGSPPIAVGIVTGAARAYIAQEHPEGRITFVDLDTGLARTLTGFELAARVVDGSEP